MFTMILAAIVGQYSGMLPQAVVTDASGKQVTAITSQPMGPIGLFPNPLAYAGSALNYSAHPPIIGFGMSTYGRGAGPILATKGISALSPTAKARLERQQQLMVTIGLAVAQAH